MKTSFLTTWYIIAKIWTQSITLPSTSDNEYSTCLSNFWFPYNYYKSKFITTTDSFLRNKVSLQRNTNSPTSSQWLENLKALYIIHNPLLYRPLEKEITFENQTDKFLKKPTHSIKQTLNGLRKKKKIAHRILLVSEPPPSHRQVPSEQGSLADSKIFNTLN